ncbi:MFS transporter [Halobacterium salinarum]|uniref:MFS transporter n=1 Tax=Halobacterium salinarum TaxID=2242 RepID=UPI0025546474|nr:MFS transporter [Halobacterium salinarum]MDL0120259.1 MFS transporter [Halobacterium salinarum]
MAGFRLRKRIGSVNPTILRYYAYSVSTSVGFYTPVLYLLFLSTGLDFTEIALLETVFMLTTLVGEVPTGWVGDRIGWRRSLLVANGLIAGTVLGMAVASSLLGFLALHVTWSLGYNFRSGSEDAWLYETVSRELEADEFARVQGRARSYELLVGTASSLLGGVLAERALVYPFIAASAVTLLGVPVLMTLPDIDAAQSETFSYRDAVGVVKSTLQTPGLRRFLSYFLVIVYLTAAANVFIQPIVRDIGVPEAGLGAVYAGFSLASAGASYVVEDVQEYLGTRRVFVLGPLLIGGAFTTVVLFPVVVIPAFFISHMVKSVLTPVGYQLVNDGIGTYGRATALSGVAMIGSVLGITAKFGAGALADGTSAVIAVTVLGVILVGTASVGSVGWGVFDIRNPTDVQTESTSGAADASGETD